MLESCNVALNFCYCTATGTEVSQLKYYLWSLCPLLDLPWRAPVWLNEIRPSEITEEMTSRGGSSVQLMNNHLFAYE